MKRKERLEHIEKISKALVGKGFTKNRSDSTLFENGKGKRFVLTRTSLRLQEKLVNSKQWKVLKSAYVRDVDPENIEGSLREEGCVQ